jgi:hypothetical protein
MKALFLFLLMFSSLTFAQEQLALRLNENGLLKIMKMALQYNSGTSGNTTVVIPQEIYKFTIKQRDLADNPVVQILNDISNLNLNKNLDFYLHTSDIKVTGVVDQKSLVTEISNSGPDGFDVKLSINLSKVTVTGTSLSLCENRLSKSKKCGNGLKTTVSGLKITTLNRPVVLSTNLRLSVKKGMASVKILSVYSNLESSKYAPTLDINFSSLTVPRIAVVINGQETELDTSRLRGQILERKAFLGKKLMAFAGDFIANDLAEMINVYLKNTEVATTLQVYNREAPARTYNDYDYQREFRTVAIDNTYVRPPVIIKPMKPVVYTPSSSLPTYQTSPANDVMKILMDQFTQVVRQAQIDLALKKISTPANKDVELKGVLNFILNKTTFKVGNTLGNSTRTLPALNLSAYRGHDINLAISEPVLNGALDLAGSTGLFRDLLEQITDLDALSLNSLKIHFTKTNSLKAIANVSVDLKKMRTNIWKDPQGWAETGIGTWLERNNNNSVIYFPIEIEIVPVVVRDASTGGVKLSVKLKSVFNGDNLLNTYGYPSNVGNMFKIVRKGVLSKLHTQLDEYADKTFDVDLDKFLNQSGVEFVPKSIVFNQAAYMLINLDIKNIKFNSKNPTKK